MCYAYIHWVDISTPGNSLPFCLSGSLRRDEMAVLVCSAILLRLALTLAQTPPFEFASDREPNNRRQEEPSFSCTAGPDGTECLRQTRLLLLEQEGKRSWVDAHRLCRERDMFLVPSEETLSLVRRSGLVAQLPSPVIDIWAGAHSLQSRPILFQWLLPRGESRLQPGEMPDVWLSDNHGLSA